MGRNVWSKWCFGLLPFWIPHFFDILGIEEPMPHHVQKDLTSPLTYILNLAKVRETMISVVLTALPIQRSICFRSSAAVPIAIFTRHFATELQPLP